MPSIARLLFLCLLATGCIPRPQPPEPQILDVYEADLQRALWEALAAEPHSTLPWERGMVETADWSARWREPCRESVLWIRHGEAPAEAFYVCLAPRDNGTVGVLP